MNGRLAFGAAAVAAAVSFTVGNLSVARGDDAAGIKAQITNVPLPVTAPKPLNVVMQSTCGDSGKQSWDYLPDASTITPAIRAAIDQKIMHGYTIVAVTPSGTILFVNHVFTCS